MMMLVDSTRLVVFLSDVIIPLLKLNSLSLPQFTLVSSKPACKMKLSYDDVREEVTYVYQCNAAFVQFCFLVSFGMLLYDILYI
jgi:hypothetical protein